VAGLLQIRDLNRGSFGFVQLARAMDTGKEVAIKFIDRGSQVLFRYACTMLDATCVSTRQPWVIVHAALRVAR
jgi:hypothetical protein